MIIRIIIIKEEENNNADKRRRERLATPFLRAEYPSFPFIFNGNKRKNAFEEAFEKAQTAGSGNGRQPIIIQNEGNKGGNTEKGGAGVLGRKKQGYYGDTGGKVFYKSFSYSLYSKVNNKHYIYMHNNRGNNACF
jgi:hypothetical protein